MVFMVDNKSEETNMNITHTVLELLTRAATDLEAAHMLATPKTEEKKRIGELAQGAYALVSDSAKKSSEGFQQ
jgi:hypothetical protein